MNNEQRNLLIAVIAILVIAAGIIIYSKNKNTVLEPSLQEETGFSSPGGEENSEGDGLINPGVTPVAPALDTSASKAAYNSAMSNASKAFLAGNYTLAIKYYNEALAVKELDTAYMGLYLVHAAQENWAKAEWAINKALDINSRVVEYWNSKLTLLDERTGATYADLKAVYELGLARSDARTKINLVTHFANISEWNGEKGEAISIWEYAKELNPAKASIYQAEINRLSN